MSPVTIKRPPPGDHQQRPPKRFRPDLPNPLDGAGSSRVPAHLPPRPHFTPFPLKPAIPHPPSDHPASTPLSSAAPPGNNDSEPEEGELDDAPPPPVAVPKPPSGSAPVLPPPPPVEEPKATVKFFPFKMKNKAGEKVLDKRVDLTVAPSDKAKPEPKGKERDERATSAKASEEGETFEREHRPLEWERSPDAQRRADEEDRQRDRRGSRLGKRDTWVPSPEEERPYNSWKDDDYRARSPLRSPAYRPRSPLRSPRLRPSSPRSRLGRRDHWEPSVDKYDHDRSRNFDSYEDDRRYRDRERGGGDYYRPSYERRSRSPPAYGGYQLRSPSPPRHRHLHDNLPHRPPGDVPVLRPVDTPQAVETRLSPLPRPPGLPPRPTPPIPRQQPAPPRSPPSTHIITPSAPNPPHESLSTAGAGPIATPAQTRPSSPKQQVKAPKRPPKHRTPQEEHTAYGRIFTGCSRLGAYDLLNKLGEGTFGEVHKGRSHATGQLVALKRILMHEEREGIPITALREVKLLKRLKHPNVVPVVDMVVTKATKESKGDIYMVFPYMDHDLAGLLENKSVRLTPGQIKLYMKQLLEGTDYLHRNNILHRDMKAANLLISNSGVLQIADFGLARPGHSRLGWDGIDLRKTRYTNCVVTRWYRPPELLLGETNYTFAIDIWGVGCIMGQMWTRRPMFCGSSDLNQLEKIWSLCGTPTEDNMPGWGLLPGCEGVKTWPRQERTVKPQFEPHGRDTADLLDKMLLLDPHRRITAAQALDHEWFWTDPLPADPKSLSQYEASHEYDKRKAQIDADKRHKAWQAAQSKQAGPSYAGPSHSNHHQPPPPEHQRPENFRDSRRGPPPPRGDRYVPPAPPAPPPGRRGLPARPDYNGDSERRGPPDRRSDHRSRPSRDEPLPYG